MYHTNKRYFGTLNYIYYVSGGIYLVCRNYFNNNFSVLKDILKKIDNKIFSRT